MSEKKKLSHSACGKYMDCPFSFDAYYNQKLQPIKKGSPLVFGNGMDAAINAMLLTSHDAEPIDEYRRAVAETELGRMTPSKYDFDADLLDSVRIELLLKKLNQVGYKGDDPIKLYYSLMDKQDLSENQEKALDLICREVLEVKAELMIKAYKKIVLPYILKVYNVQKASGPGYLDATVEWRGKGKIILDNKTSGQRYQDNAVEYSTQLAMYAAEEKINNVAYVVMVKNIKKNKEKICSECGNNGTGKRHKSCDYIIDDGARCAGEWTETINPEAEIQIIHGVITDKVMEVAAELQRNVQVAVDAKLFHCNAGKCNSMYGKQCEYKDYKHKGSLEGLELRGKKK